jgi:cytochrome c peroxidase
MRLLAVAVIISTWLPGTAAFGQLVVIPPPDLNPLNQTPVPEPPQLSLYVKNKTVAIQLGKAFFWDMQTGSDGVMACATCHHGPGMVDKRLKNTLNPGTNGGDAIFGNSGVQGVPGYPQFGPNYTLDPVNDFPLHRRQGSGHLQTDPVVQDTNDVVGSQGVRLSDFVGVGAFSDPSVDSAPASEVDPVFHDPVYGNLRRVTGRNTPTVINAVFNFSNFWDGRAHFRFNGENPFGPLDPSAGVWFDDPAQAQLVKRPVLIEFASLASQSVGPPMDTTEMSGRGRTFPMLGRKLLGLTPLGKQLVSHDDSVLGGLAKSAVTPGAKGLHTSYDQLIRQAFNNNLWSSPKLTPDGFTQMEANFSLFWGLAIQLYESTLISDDSPFDRWLAGDDFALTENQKFGFALFSGIGNCTACHFGNEFTDHSVSFIGFLNNFINGTIGLMFAADGRQTIYDEGFINNAIRPTEEDVGRGGNAPFVNPRTGQVFPLSTSRLAVLQRNGQLPFESPILEPFIPVDMPVVATGCFKVPSLRNIELTGPYFHNGSDMTLDDVVDFYSRGGNFPQHNIHELDPVIGAGLTLIANNQPLHEAITDFLTSLTDQRVRIASAPFDHPELFIPEGDPEVLTRIPATDSNGIPITPVLAINPVTTPTNQASQTISGTVEAGSTPTVTVNTSATVGPVTVNGTAWSVQISGLAEGANVVTVTAVDSQSVVTTLETTIVLDTAPPALTLNPVTTPTNLTSQTISGTVEAGIKPTVTVTPPVTASPVVITGGTTWGSVISNLQEGANNITITAADSAGNVMTIQGGITRGDPLPSNTFNDVPTNHWAYSQVEAVFAAGITGGCSTQPSLFCPDAPVTRGQMAVFIETSLGRSPRECPGQFADVPASDPFCGFIERLAEDGITGGCGNGNFCPNEPVTRGQMAVFIESALGNSSNGCTEQFADVKADNPFCGFIERFAGDGISGGCGNGNFCPDNPVTRAEMAVFLVAAPNPILP